MLANCLRLTLCVLPLLSLGACTSSYEFRELADDYVPPPDPAIAARIAAYEAASSGGRQPGITRVSYNGKPAFLFAAPCCDHFDYLYDANGQRLCAPTGGIAGAGDGKCLGVLAPDDSPRAGPTAQ